jgi:hypothetical protein
MRIAFDLDSTLIPSGNEFETEKHLKFFTAKLIGGVELRKGTRDIFNYYKTQKWETWIYTTSFRSPFYIKKLFWLNGIALNGIVNQKRHIKEVSINSSKYPPQFGIDWLIDDSKGVEIEGNRYGFNVIQVNPTDENWVETIKNKLTEM